MTLANRGASIVCGTALASLLLAASAEAQMSPPPRGAEYAFSCNSSVRSNYTETYRIESVQGTQLRVVVDDGVDRNWYEKPTHLLNTTLFDRQSLFGKQSEFDDLPGAFRKLADLKVGTKVVEWVTERRDDPAEKLSWKYTVSILGTEVFYLPDVGELEVYSISESRWVDRYSAVMLSFYSADLKFPVYWSYRDSNLAEVECTLVALSGLSTQAVRGAGFEVTPSSFGFAPQAETGVRQYPYDQAPMIAILPAAEAVEVTGQTDRAGGSWYRVRLSDDREGYIPAATPGEPARLAAAGSAMAAASPEPAPPAPATRSVETAPSLGAPSGPAAGADDQAARLAELQGLHDSGLITDEEYRIKRSEILGERSGAGIADELRQANRRFRDGELSQQAFIEARSKALAKINTRVMAPREGLVLIQELLEDRLISQSEYSRLRSQMLAAL